MYEIIIKMPFNRTMNIIAIVFGSLIAPYWYLFNFFPEILLNKDIFQIILVCTSISFPPFFINFIILIMCDRRFKSKVNKAINFKFMIMGFIALTISLAFYIPVAVFYGVQLSKQDKIEYTVWFHVGFIIAGILATLIKDIERRIIHAKLTSKRLGLRQSNTIYIILIWQKAKTQFKNQFKGR